jgi:hypothetical protein
MKKIQVATATNTQLDWLVAKCENRTPSLHEYSKGQGNWFILMQTGVYRTVCAFSTEWSQMGPIIERKRIGLSQFEGFPCQAYIGTPAEFQCSQFAPEGQPLIAAARCYVASELGETAEVPEEL